MTTTEICFVCYQREATLIDLQGRQWCQPCVNSQLGCISCGIGLDGHVSVQRHGVTCCTACARRVPEPAAAAVCCEVCGSDLTDGAGCRVCDPIPDLPEWANRLVSAYEAGHNIFADEVTKRRRNCDPIPDLTAEELACAPKPGGGVLMEQYEPNPYDGTYYED